MRAQRFKGQGLEAQGSEVLHCACHPGDEHQRGQKGLSVEGN